jgi:hypothetical protein
MIALGQSRLDHTLSLNQRGIARIGTPEPGEGLGFPVGELLRPDFAAFPGC